jgi:hypothetical protein
MTPRAALSPAWLGLFALASFGGLVVTSFASGYHLVMKTAPLSAPALPAASSALSAGTPQSSNVDAPQSPPDVVQSARAAADPAEAIVRQNLTPDRALVRSQPKSGSVVARLPSNQRVALRGRDGQWLRIEYERNGKRVVGWTQESNLILR